MVNQCKDNIKIERLERTKGWREKLPKLKEEKNSLEDGKEEVNEVKTRKTNELELKVDRKNDCCVKSEVISRDDDDAEDDRLPAADKRGKFTCTSGSCL